MTLSPQVDDIHCISVPTHFPVGPVNSYLLVGRSPVLVDCGPAIEEAEVALRAGLAARGLAPSDLGAIVLTHHHPDHAGGLGWLRQETSAPILGHPYNDLWLRGCEKDLRWQADFYAWLFRYCDSPIPARTDLMKRARDAAADTGHATVGLALREGDSVELGDAAWQVLETPGHAGTSITLVCSDGVAIGGDTLLHRISSNALAEPPYPGDAQRHLSLPVYRRSLSRLACLDLMLVLPGHGQSFTDHAALIERRLRNQEERGLRLLEGLDAGRATIYALVHFLFPGIAEAQLFLGLSEVLGHLDVLEESRAVRHVGEAPARYERT
jgi:glyoxylase-like metal-dependent hydrolase (beta-lactamase superfamily II)